MDIPVPTEELDYDEDVEELFTGPSFADDSLEEEYEEPEISDEQTGAQSGGMITTTDATGASGPVLGSQYTQLGAAPGSPAYERLSGHRESEPEQLQAPARSAQSEDKTVIEFASSESGASLLAPDGTPLEASAKQLGETRK